MSELKDSAPMTPADVRHARDVLGLSPDHLAAELGLIPDIVEGFEAGTVRVPPRVASLLRWRVAVAEREQVLETAGHGHCPTVVDLKERVARPGADFAALSKAYDAHAASCQRCQAREAFARSLPPLPAPPSSASARAFMAYNARIARLPQWARPIAWGVTIIGVIALLRIIIGIFAT